MTERNPKPDLILALLQLPTDTYQSYLEGLQNALGGYGVVTAAIYARSLQEQERLELIAYAGKRPDSSTTMPSIRRQFTFVFEHQLCQGRTIHLALRTRNTPGRIAIITKIMKMKFDQLALSKKQHIRSLTIEQSLRSRDVSSFAYKLLRSLREEVLYCDDLALFLYDASLERLDLAATTSELSRVARKDVYYAVAEPGKVTTAFLDNQPSFEYRTSGFAELEYDKYMYRGDLYSRAYWPISLTNIVFKHGPALTLSPIGVLRITNIYRHDGEIERRTNFSDYDVFIISFVIEVMFVLLQQYSQAANSKFDFGRLTHGLGSNIDAAHKFAQEALKALYFDSDRDGEAAGKPRFQLLDSNASTDDVYYDLVDLLNFLEDADFQLSKSNGAPTFNSAELIDDFHSLVLMPALRMTSAIAAANSKLNPIVSSLKGAGSLSLPKVTGNKEAYISVLRNLLENSIKYSSGRARIDFSFHVEEERVVIDYSDQGIGVQREHVEQIFVEGFRSAQARRTSNRGIGVGLSYSRQIMRWFGGDLECIYKEGGARFRLTFRRGG